jgi:hypothetical protein
MLRKGVITPCTSPWAAPVILVPKKSVDDNPKYRFCTDFRGFNSVTNIPVYPIPDIKSNISLMVGSKYFTLLDTENAYWNIPIKEDKDTTGFVMPFDSFRCEKMAFGVAGHPATFSKVMDAVLVGLRDVECLVYLDHLLIFSEAIEDHAHRMRLVFDRIRETHFKLGVTKCTFAVSKVVYKRCPQSFRTFKIARHCVDLAGRGKCYSLEMSLANCVAKTELPDLA